MANLPLEESERDRAVAEKGLEERGPCSCSNDDIDLVEEAEDIGIVAVPHQRVSCRWRREKIGLRAVSRQPSASG